MCQIGAYERSRQMTLLASDSEIPTSRPMWKTNWIRFCLGGNKWRRISMGVTDTINVNVFISLSSQYMGCWVRTLNSYLLIWVHSWPQKWRNQFFTLRVGLTTILQLRSRGRSPRSSKNLGFQVPYITRSQTGSRVQDWAWHNTFLVPKYFCEHLRNFNHLKPSSI